MHASGLQAVADLFRVKIYVLTSFIGSDFIEICPLNDNAQSRRILYVSFWAEVSIVPLSEVFMNCFLKSASDLMSARELLE